MDQLRFLDTLSRYSFGILTTTNDDITYLKLKKDMYVLTTSTDKCDLITIEPTVDSVQLTLEKDFSLELKLGEIYYLSPVPIFVDVDQCVVRKYLSVDKLYNTNANFEDCFEKVLKRRVDILVSAIGSKRLKMTCWPFQHFSLTAFLKQCSIPYAVGVKFDEYSSKTYLYDSDISHYLGHDDDYPPDYANFVEEKIDGFLFQDLEKPQLRKEIVYQFKEQIYNGSSLTNGSTIVESEEEVAFVIFNHDQMATRKDDEPLEIILPTSTLPLLEVVF
jgi:hypothetical protein